MKQHRWAIGVDFGGTNIKLGLVDGRRRLIAMTVAPTRSMRQPDAFAEGLSTLTQALLQRTGIPMGSVLGLGLGAPGLIETTRGIVHTLVNVPGWREVPLARDLSRRLHLPVFLDNDANLMALGEWRCGAGRGAEDLLGVTLGTGVGGGLILHHRVYRGVRGAAGEVGHMVLDPDGPRCGCGGRGCLEAFIGTAAIVRRARTIIRARVGRLPTLSARESRGGVTPALISEAASQGDASAKRLWQEVGYWLGLGLANVVNLLNLDHIVIGGGVANAWAYFAPQMRSTLRANAMAMPGRAVRVVRGTLGDRAGVLGAATLVREELARKG